MISKTPMGDMRFAEFQKLGEPRNAWEREMMRIVDFQLSSALRNEKDGSVWEIYGAQMSYAYIDGLVYAIKRAREMAELATLALPS
jgi:hypothetical protein